MACKGNKCTLGVNGLFKVKTEKKDDDEQE